MQADPMPDKTIDAAGRRTIFDIGFHKGEDTQRYLAQGFHVVAVEANPLLARRGKEKFFQEIADGSLVLLDVGIAEEPSERTFWVNHSRTEWSSFHPDLGQRGKKGFHSLSVQCTTLGSLIGSYGVPYYLKVDIEGNDHLCIRSLTGSEIPRYVSCEACELGWLELLRERGYTKFKLINQFDGFRAFDESRERSAFRGIRNTLRWQAVRAFGRFAEFPPGSSGPFGEKSDGGWHDFDHIAAQYKSFNLGLNLRLNGRSWFDFHATYDVPAVGPSPEDLQRRVGGRW